MITKQNETWPNFFIVGAAKAGTTSLYHYLKEIPGVYMSEVKEPYYFSPHPYTQQYAGGTITDKDEYLSLFRHASGHTAIGEASPSYLWDPDSPKLIHQAAPAARIIILLRDPIERTHSHYLMKTKFSHKKMSFYDQLMSNNKSEEKGFDVSKIYLEFSLYYEQVKRYFDLFGRDQVKVIIYEEFIKHPEESVNDVLTFLGVSYKVMTIAKQYNPSSAPRTLLSPWVYSIFSWLRTKGIITSKMTPLLSTSLTSSIAEKFLFKKIQKPRIEPQAFEFLQDMYYEDTLRLQTLLGRSLPWPCLSGNRKNKS
jgi:hypothetical protein